MNFTQNLHILTPTLLVIFVEICTKRFLGQSGHLGSVKHYPTQVVRVNSPSNYSRGQFFELGLKLFPQELRPSVCPSVRLPEYVRLLSSGQFLARKHNYIQVTSA
jgi:hypothetical protein